MSVITRVKKSLQQYFKFVHDKICSCNIDHEMDTVGKIFLNHHTLFKHQVNSFLQTRTAGIGSS